MNDPGLHSTTLPPLVYLPPPIDPPAADDRSVLRR